MREVAATVGASVNGVFAIAELMHGQYGWACVWAAFAIAFLVSAGRSDA